MSRIRVHVVPVLKDNYTYLVEDTTNQDTLVIDPAEEGPVNRYLEEHQLKPVAIWITHDHADHIDGIPGVIQKWGKLPITASQIDQNSVPGVTQTVKEGDTLQFGGDTVQVFEVPGHTKGHIAYYFPSGHVFTGDLLFGYSCGNVMAGMMDTMYRSISKLLKLPDATQVYVGHEYTLNNPRWAETVEPENQEIVERSQRETKPPTIPLNLGQEKRTNPFLRCHLEAARKFTGKSDPAEVFTALRTHKNNFK